MRCRRAAARPAPTGWPPRARCRARRWRTRSARHAGAPCRRATRARARSSASPAAVGTMPRRPRTSSGAPTFASSAAMRLLTAEATMASRVAARAMLRFLADGDEQAQRDRVEGASHRGGGVRGVPIVACRIGTPMVPKYRWRRGLECLKCRPMTPPPLRPPRRSPCARSACATACRSSPRTLPTAHKLEWLRAAHAAGLREIEVGSFVPARLLPQLADTAELVAHGQDAAGATVASVLVPNLKGAERAHRVGRATRCCCRCRPATRTAWPTCARRPTRWSPRSRRIRDRARRRAARAA